MKHCPNCNAPAEDDQRFCRTCGEPLPEILPEEEPAPAVTPVVMAAPVPVVEEESQEACKEEPREEVKAEPAVPEKQPELVPVISTGSWVKTFFLWAITPFLLSVVTGIFAAVFGADNSATAILGGLTGVSGLLFMVVGAFHKDVNPSKRTFFRACLIFTVIATVIAVILIIVLLVVVAVMAPVEEWLEIVEESLTEFI